MALETTGRVARPAIQRWFWTTALVLMATTPLPLRAADCNQNDVEDAEEIAAGQSEDCNRNGIPDECETGSVRLGFRPRIQPVPAEPEELVIGDLDGDGLDDLVVASRDPGPGRPSVLTLFLGSEETSLEEVETVPAGSNLTAVTAADFDADGDLDLATANSEELLIFSGDGAGGLQQSGSLPVDRFTRFVVAGEVTGDGVADLVSANNSTDIVTVFRGESGGTFQSARAFFPGERPREIALADLNGDRIDDLAVRNIDSDTISIHLATGGGNVSPGRSYDSGNRPASLTLADLDTDGDRDLAVIGSFSGGQAVGVRHNLGDGSFGDLDVLPSAGGLIRTADIDLDGRDDLLASRSPGHLRLLTQVQPGRFGSFGFTIHDFGPLGAGDFDGDGWPDIALVGASKAQLRVLHSGIRTTFSFELAQTVRVGGRPHGGAAGDFDGDGLDDIFVGTGPRADISIFPGQPNGELASPVSFPSAVSRIEDVAVGDLDGDGDHDMIGCDTTSGLLAVYSNPGDGGYPLPDTYAVGREPRWATLADLDGDGLPEVVNSNTAESTVMLHQNQGNGAFGDRREFRVGIEPRGIAVPDLDGDGDLDVVVGTRGTLAIFLNDEGRLPESPVSLEVPGSADFVAAGDFNEDGRPDLATANSDQGTLAIILGDADARLDEIRIVELGEPAIHLVVADLNGDDHLDIATANGRADSVTAIAGTGTGGFELPFTLGTTHQIAIVVIAADLAGDGDVDLVSGDHDAQEMEVFTNQSTSILSTEYLETVCTPADLERLSVVSSTQSNVELTTKYTLPVRDDAQLLPTVFQNSNLYLLHQEFLAGAFPERFPALTTEDYNNLIFRRSTREYYVGVISRLRTRGGIAYGFSVVTDTSASELLTLEEIREVRERLQRSFFLEPFGYFPDSFRAREVAEGFVDPGFPVYLDDGAPLVTYQAYTRAIGYGRVRILDEEEFEEANESGQVSFQNVLILERSPRDIEGVVGGVLTAEPQGELSHLSIRTARRKTPNAFVENATEEFADFEGKLVRIEVSESEAVLREATLEEAEEFWAANRPQLSQLPRLDGAFQELSSLEEIAAMDETEAQEPRFGGKATNLARLGNTLTGSPFDALRERGFAIPVYYYLDFLRANTIPSRRDPGRTITYEEYLGELFASEDFISDSSVRFEELDSFRDFARDNGQVDPTLVERIHSRVAEIFPSTRTPVRFRSSSNVEDALEFNGAGLYESTGGCVDDDLDDDDDGPSLCDPDKNNERGVERALKKVWTSVYTFRAFEERAFYGIPEDQVGMGILVSRAFPDELANGVAFTGNLTNPRDKRFVITVQAGEESVVSPDPGVLPEKNVLEIADGEVVNILRPQRGSTLVAPGVWVLDEEHLSRLGAAMAFIDRHLPIDLGTQPRENVLLDMEFKLEPDNSLAIKQVRPFLLSVEPPPTPEFTLEIPHGLEVCGVFQVANDRRGPLEELRLKSRVRLRAGVYPLTTESDSFATALIDSLRVQAGLEGPGQETAVPLSENGVFRVTRFQLPDGVSRYRFRYQQDFTITSGETIRLELVSGVEFEARGDESISGPLVLDEAFFTSLVGEEALQTSIDGVPLIRYGDCHYAAESRFSIDVTLEDGTEIELRERWQVPDNLLDTGPARLVHARLRFGNTERRVADYWKLVYSAFRHNLGVRYWVLLDPPVSLQQVEGAIHAVEVIPPETPGGETSAAYLGEGFQTLRLLSAQSYEKGETEAPMPGHFLRGDARGDGALDIADAIVILGYLFRREPLECLSAADFTDDGRINLVDALGITHRLFGDGESPTLPFPDCGSDPTQDELSCDRVEACP